MKKNKLFIQSMIITAVIGLTTLMIFMFIGIKYITRNSIQTISIGEKALAADKAIVPFNSVILGVIHELANDQITVFDVEKRQYVTTAITDTTKIKDEREKTIPLVALTVGDVIEINYEPAKDNLLSISQSSNGWKKTDIKNAIFNKPQSEIKIGSNTYTYTGKTLILDEEGKKVDNIHFVGPYDTLELTGVNDQVYSIRILETQGFIELEDLPVTEGRLEIDINRQVNIAEMTKPIPLQAGSHKLVMHLKGYEPVIRQIQVESGETLIVTASDAERIYYDYNINVTNGGDQYVVDIDGKKYKPSQAIKVTSGKHLVTIIKQGYKVWQKNIDVVDHGELEVTLSKAPIVPKVEVKPEIQPTPELPKEEEAKPPVEVQPEPELPKEEGNKPPVEVQPEPGLPTEEESKPPVEVQPEPELPAEEETKPPVEVQPEPEIPAEPEVQPGPEVQPEPEV